MVDDNYKSDQPELELNSNIDESKLSDVEKKMLADLQESKELPPIPTAISKMQTEETQKEPEATTTTLESLPKGKIAESISAPFPTEPVLQPTPMEDPPPAPEEPPDYVETGDTSDADAEPLSGGSESPLVNCPHCNWDLSKQTIVEPDQDEKMGFLHSVLGQKPFIQQYDLFGGKVIVRFRTLTTKEMDTIYNVVFQQRESGAVTTIQDYWEKVNRYRLYLQLTYLASSDGSFTHTLPDSYSKETNPSGEHFWDFAGIPEDMERFNKVENTLLTDVLRTETIQRTISNYCARFNRLVSKLEVMIDSPDFWSETE
jgi:hypothetical protein